MKVILTIIGLVVSSCAFCQNKITGRWKPVFVSIDKIITADLKADTIFLADTIDVTLKNFKDIEASKKMLRAMISIIVYKMQAIEREFTAPDNYTEINKQTNTSKEGTYTFAETTNLLTTVLSDDTVKYAVSFLKDHLILTSELGATKRMLIVEYEKK